LYGQKFTFFFVRFGETKMRNGICQRPGWALAIIAACGTSAAAWAQEWRTPPMAAEQQTAPMQTQQPDDALNFGDIRARFDQQQQQIAALQEQLRSMQASPQITPVAEYSAQGDAAKKQEDDAKKAGEGYQIGSDMSIKGTFKNGLFPWFETPNKDFSLHLSGWTQLDNVWWTQTPAMTAAKGANAGPAQGVASGDTLGGIGNLQDGTYFRRIRLSVEGNFWENGVYCLIPAFENEPFNQVGLDEMWVGAQKIPLVGTVRLGHVKTPMGLEADMTGSSRAMTFMERSAYSESIELNQNFVTGAWFGNHIMNDRMTWSAAIFRPDQISATGAMFGDSQWGTQVRLTGLPLYEDEGRHLLHLGVSGGWRSNTNNIANDPFALNTIQLRARPELRDDIPGGGALNADANRMIDTGVIASDSDWLMGLEALYIRGPFSFQAEYGWNWVDNAVGINPSPTGLHPALIPAQNYMFNGGYVQLAYTLTGENRGYSTTGGGLAREYFGKAGPYEPAFVVRDCNGNLIWGRGAWEIAARYSYVDLNSGNGGDRIQGGIMNGVSLGLNWYLNTNLTANFDWVYNNRYDVPDGTIAGYTSGFGARVQFQF
jgi:phosphate-selective porin OprO and OprP